MRWTATLAALGGMLGLLACSEPPTATDSPAPPQADPPPGLPVDPPE